MSNVQSTPPQESLVCVVKPLDRVTFTPYEVSALKPQISGTIFNTLDTNTGHWRVRIVRSGQSFPFGEAVNVYTNEGTFQVHGVLNPDTHPAVA